MDLITTRTLSKAFIEDILQKAQGYEKAARAKKNLTVLKGKTLATLFFEPSTRTQMSFQAAMLRLGGNFVGFSDPKSTSASKGETLADTIRVVEGYAHAIVMRHAVEGAPARAAELTDLPVINAGDGSNQHPSQALLDLFTLQQEKGKIDGLTVLLAGDLKYGRTVHSLMYALSHYDVDIQLFSPPSLKMPESIVNDVKERVSVKEVTDFGDADVVYATRVQRERFADAEEYQRSLYTIDEAMLSKIKSDAIILHPLPRVKEIAPEVDLDSRAKYFQQSFYGVPTRMAILETLIGASND
ncbi:aspartate carbamoyltransferase [Candidatus Micrarchaeota archaeon]|nr:aspartate carbamoyltransferase [Candidatus Micrarchaeota archaeon]